MDQKVNQQDVRPLIEGVKQEISNKLSGVKQEISNKSSIPSSSNKSSFDNPAQPPQKQREQNCIFQICYNGEARQFALAGQLLRKDQEFDPIPPLM